jgi:flagellar biosynthesis/type III secretory pathway M-ring protein FliF/YscJ
MADFTKVEVEPVGAAGVNGVKASSASAVTFAPPITGLLVLLIVLVGIVAVRVNRRRRAASAAAAIGQDAERDHDHEPQLQSP